MKKFFVINGNTFNSISFSWVILSLSVFFSVHSNMYIYLAPLNILLSIVVLTDIIQMLIWTYTGFAFKIDFEQKEIILNHSLLFYKKKISFEHILKIGVEKKKSFIVVDQAVLLNKWQKYLSKGNKGTYKIRLTAIPSHYFELLQTIFNLQQHDNLFYE